MYVNSIIRLLRKIRLFRLAQDEVMFFRNDACVQQFLKEIEQCCFDDFSAHVFAEDKQRIVDTISSLYPSSIERTLMQADAICDHDFDLLGSGTTNLGKSIDWHTDFIHDFTWDTTKRYVTTGDYVDCYLHHDILADVKVPWELSRFQHLPTLGKAFWYTNDKKYVDEFVEEINQWIDDNPFYYGVNWASTMDVSIRAVNWIWGYHFLKDADRVSDGFQKKFLKSLYQHGLFISQQLDYDVYPGNHLLSDSVGLIYLGVFFRKNKKGKQWLQTGLNLLVKELEHQILDDGVHFEGSISYHRLVTELVASCVLLCLRNNVQVKQKVLDTLELMIDFIFYYIKPDGSCPIIGDADDGRLHKFSFQKINDHRYLVDVGQLLFTDNRFNKNDSQMSEESFWMNGGKLNGSTKMNGVPGKTSIGSKAFSDAGFFIMRKENLYLFICGGHSSKPKKTSHVHNDALSFELFAGDKTFIVDPGTYVYTSQPNWRNKFRSTSYHNTVVIDGIEQNRLDEKKIFDMNQFDTIAKLNKWETNSAYDLFDGEHYGYQKLPNPVTHRRKIYFDKKESLWKITDYFNGKGVHQFDWYFHFAPMKIEKDKKDPLIIQTRSDDDNIELIPEKDAELKSMVEEGWISPSYRRKIKAPVGHYLSKNRKVPFSLSFTIRMV